MMRRSVIGTARPRRIQAQARAVATGVARSHRLEPSVLVVSPEEQP